MSKAEEARSYVGLVVWLLWAVQILLILASLLADFDAISVIEDAGGDVDAQVSLATVLTHLALIALGFGLVNQIVNPDAIPLMRIFAFVYFVVFTAVLYAAAADPASTLTEMVLGG
ncbi:MAG: hypothetical protein IH840_11205 [Candidatus Heimdallarchaeota archaeon]|nr:hypothetical protein [Candidatus Heimdallarchaeota archaeon]